MNSREERAEEEYEDGVLELENEDGTVEKFYHLATVEYKGAKYGVFQLAEPQTEEDDGAFIFSMEEDGDDVILNEIEDDELADAVFQVYLEEYEEYGEDE